jgi:hypothetical protein
VSLSDYSLAYITRIQYIHQDGEFVATDVFVGGNSAALALQFCDPEVAEGLCRGKPLLDFVDFFDLIFKNREHVLRVFGALAVQLS